MPAAPSSWPGLSRPSTSLDTTEKTDVNARDSPGMTDVGAWSLALTATAATLAIIFQTGRQCHSNSSNSSAPTPPARSARSAGGRGWRWRIRGCRRKPFRGASPRSTRSRRMGRRRCRCCSTAKRAVVDSWTIANYLEDTYPDRPSLFGGEGGRAVGRMLNWWGDGVIGGIFPLIIADIPLNLKPDDAAYFRRTREARFGKPLEEIMAEPRQGGRRISQIARSAAADAEDAGLSRRGRTELRGLYRVRRVPVGAGGQPVQAARRGRSGLRLA